MIISALLIHIPMTWVSDQYLSRIWSDQISSPCHRCMNQQSLYWLIYLWQGLEYLIRSCWGMFGLSVITWSLVGQPRREGWLKKSVRNAPWNSSFAQGPALLTQWRRHADLVCLYSLIVGPVRHKADGQRTRLKPWAEGQFAVDVISYWGQSTLRPGFQSTA